MRTVPPAVGSDKATWCTDRARRELTIFVEGADAVFTVSAGQGQGVTRLKAPRAWGSG